MIKKKLILGLTQFGMNYGVMNTFKDNKDVLLSKVLKICKKDKIEYLYTSTYYGNANKLLAKKKLKKFKIIIKFKYKDFLKKNLNFAISKIQKKLKIKNFTLMIDGFENLNKNIRENVYKKILYLKKNKIIKKFGFSIYYFKNVKNICRNYKPDIIQCPYNLIDRRLENNNLLKFFHQNKIQVDVRSIFLQGILLSNTKKIPAKFKIWKKLFKKFENWSMKNKINKINACVSFIFKNKHISRALIGVDNLEQFKEILSLKLHKNIKFPNLRSNDQNLINPSKW